MKQSFTSLIFGVALTCALLMTGSSIAYGEPAMHQAADNSAVNKADRNSAAPTADNAKNSMSDRELMKHIRQDVVKDKSLSSYGHNVKIVARHGKVTLRGPVHSDQEKQAIEEHATKYAGAGNVTNELTVKSA